MNPPLLVVTPTLGTSSFLDDTVASVAAQPLPLVHVLAAPECQVLVLQARYPRVRVIADQGAAAGLYGALNAALAWARFRWAWFTYINDDDVLLPGFGEVVRRHLASIDPEPVTYGNVELIDEAGRHAGFVTVERDPRWIPALLQQGISPLMQQGMLFRRDCVARLRGFNTGYILCADLDFWLRARAAGERFRYYPVPVARFRLRRGQLSANTAVTVREQGQIVSRLFPARLPAWRRVLARWRYRWLNLPHYLERLWHHGCQTSYDLLEDSR